MRVIHLEQTQPTLNEVIDLASEETVVLRQPDGKVFALAQVDEFALEVELLRNNADFMALMRDLSEEDGLVSLQELRQELGV